MNDLATIADRAAAEHLPFLLGDGHGVITHKHTRNTFDLDLIICRRDKEKWAQLVAAIGYRFLREGPGFLQFDALDNTAYPLDLMLVNDETFPKLQADAVPAPSSVRGVRVVSLKHLLAMKCHAIKHGHAGRFVKDADDVIQLVQINGVDLDNPGIREIFQKYGTRNSMKKSNKPVRASDNSDLEFPDWSGMDDSSSRITPEAAFRLSEQYLIMFPEAAARRRKERTEKSQVEFVL